MPMNHEVHVIEARDWIQKDPNLDLIDVRDEKEYSLAFVPEFENISLAKLSQVIPDLDQKSPILLLSHKGKESLKAVQLLAACGLKAYSIRGGIDDWSRVIDPSIPRY